MELNTPDPIAEERRSHLRLVRARGHVLVAEGDPRLQKPFVESLEDHGYRVSLVADANGLIEALCRSVLSEASVRAVEEVRFDVVICDVLASVSGTFQPGEHGSTALECDPNPPAEQLAACSGLAAGTACSFTRNGATVNGTCRASDEPSEGIICREERH